jgi:toxin ParE1/3/4
MRYRLTRTAEGQLEAILRRSAEQHGIEAAARYAELIRTVMYALGEEPWLIGSITVPRLPGVLAFPTRLGRRRVEASRRVSRPRHLIVYRVAGDGVTVILGLVHDRMVLSRAAGRLARESGQD